jgi:hypothetical protein
MKKTLGAFLMCAGLAFLASAVLLLWSTLNPPEDIFSGIAMVGWAAFAFWAGILFFVLAAGLAAICFVFSQFRREQGRCSKTAGDTFTIEHLFTVEHLP